jgi:hypothetical protein
MYKYLQPSIVNGLELSIPTIVVAKVARSPSKHHAKDLPLVQIPTALDKPFHINPHTNISTLFSQSYNTQVTQTVTTQTPKSETPFRFPNFNLSLAAPIGIGTVLVLATLGRFFFSKPKVYKQPVPNSDLLNHTQAFENIIVLAKQVQEADNEKFTDREFVNYLRIKIGLISSQENGLYKSIQFLQIAIANKRHFDQVFVVEARYLARKQQELYQFVDNLIDRNILGEDFRQQIESKLTDVLLDIPTDAGKSALQVYINSLIELSHAEYALQLLAQFKRYEMSSYALIRAINDLTTKFESMDLTESDVLLPDIMLKLDSLEDLAAIVDIPKNFVNPEGFVKIFYFMALENKQQETARQFKRFIATIEQWKPVYRTLQNIRGFYNPREYNVPKEFSLNIPGESIFNNYKALVPQLVNSQVAVIEAEYKDRNDFGIMAFF